MNSVKQWLLPAFHPLYGRLLMTELRQQGFSDEQIFTGTSILPEDFVADNEFLSYDVVQQLIGRAMELTKKPWLGVEQTTFGEAFAHGIVGFGAMAAANLGEALRFVSGFLCLRERVIGFDVCPRESDSEVGLVFYENIELGPQREFLQGTVVVNILRLLESLAGYSLENVTARFLFSEPEWQEKYHQYLNVNVEFNSPKWLIIMPSSTLLIPCIAADQNSYQSAERECERLLLSSMGGQGFVHQVKEFLLNYKNNYPSQTEVAENFHISTRTLMRRLKLSGFSFQQLLDEVRKDVAEWYLINTEDSVESISIQLGYADASNFSRTFRRWFGQTPGNYRKSKRDPVQS